jgi:hypothetical protein
MSRMYREFFDNVLDDPKRHDAMDEALNMGWNHYQELIGNYAKCHLKHKGFAVINPSMEVDILMTDYDLDAYRYGV